MHVHEFITESLDTEEEQLAAVKLSPYVIRKIPNPSEAVQVAAVQAAGAVIEYIPNPSEAVQLAAVSSNGLAIKYINDPSVGVQIAAVKEDMGAINYIDYPSEHAAMIMLLNAYETNQYLAREVINKLVLNKQIWPDLIAIAQEVNMGDLIAFASDSDIDAVLKQYYDILVDVVNEITSDWEANDDYYYTWLRDEGYVDPETYEVDWDRAPNFFEYNDDARHANKTLMYAIKVSPAEARTIVEQKQDENQDDAWDMSQLEYAMIGAIDNHMSSEDPGYDAIIDFIEKRTQVIRNPTTKEWNAVVIKKP